MALGRSRALRTADLLGQARALGARPVEVWAAHMAAPADARDLEELGAAITDGQGRFQLSVARATLRAPLLLGASARHEGRVLAGAGAAELPGREDGARLELGDLAVRGCRWLEVAVTGPTETCEVFLELGRAGPAGAPPAWALAARSTAGHARLPLPRGGGAPTRLLFVAPGWGHDTLQLGPGEEGDALVSVVFSPRAGLRTVVLDPHGDPAEGVPVSIAPAEHPWLSLSRVASGPAGHVVLAGLTAGHAYRVTLEAVSCGQIDTEAVVVARDTLPALRLEPALEVAFSLRTPAGEPLLVPRGALNLERLGVDRRWRPAELAREPGACSRGALVAEALERELDGEHRMGPLVRGTYRVKVTRPGGLALSSDPFELSPARRGPLVLTVGAD
ncbi:MAG: hypothetical protein M9894_20355 [Planctomycetes bacterium]|nr:hypothetical protein [Planctomycetota bacterium]